MTCLLSLGISSSETQFEQDWNATKEIRKEKFTLKIPSNWEVIEQKFGVDLIGLAPESGSDFFRENFNILYVKLDTPLSPEKFYEYNLQSLNQLLVDFDLESSEVVTIDNVEAKKLIFTHTMGVVNAKVIQYFLLENNNAYIMTFTAARLDFDKIRSEFEQIANSFKINRLDLD